MRLSRSSLFVLVALVSSMPAVALANAGYPLLWGGVFHLYIGNALLGLGEGTLITLLFKASPKRTIPLMVLANYLSAGAGILLLFLFEGAAREVLLDPQPLYQVYTALTVVILTAFMVTLIVEWPLCRLCFWKNERGLRSSLIATLVVQSISYVVLIVFYLSVGEASFFREVTVDPTLVEESPNRGAVYFISDKLSWEPHVFKVRLDGTGRETIAELPDDQEHWQLKLLRAAEGNGWDLVAYSTTALDDEEEIMIVEDVSARGELTPEARASEHWVGHRIAYDLRDEGDRGWEILGFDMVFRAYHQESRRTLQFGLVMPFVTWWLAYVNLLPQAQVVMQYGGQIVLLDLETGRMGLISLGHSPVVVLDS